MGTTSPHEASAPPSDPRPLDGPKTPRRPSDHPDETKPSTVAGSIVQRPEPDQPGDRRDGYSNPEDLGEHVDPAETLALRRMATGANVARTAPTTVGPTLDPGARNIGVTKTMTVARPADVRTTSKQGPVDRRVPSARLC